MSTATDAPPNIDDVMGEVLLAHDMVSLLSDRFRDTKEILVFNRVIEMLDKAHEDLDLIAISQRNPGS